MTDFKQRIIATLTQNKKPMRPHQIAKALGKKQSYVEYHLNQLVPQGRIVVFDDNDSRKYGAQLLLTSDKVRNDFLEMIINSMPNLLLYIDLSRAENDTRAFIDVMRDLLLRLEHDLQKEILNSENL